MWARRGVAKYTHKRAKSGACRSLSRCALNRQITLQLFVQFEKIQSTWRRRLGSSPDETVTRMGGVRDRCQGATPGTPNTHGSPQEARIKPAFAVSDP